MKREFIKCMNCGREMMWGGVCNSCLYCDPNYSKAILGYWRCKEINYRGTQGCNTVIYNASRKNICEHQMTHEDKPEVNTDLQSTIEEKGEVVTQVLTFVGGQKKTFTGVISSSIKQGQFTKFTLKDGRLVMINDSNVLCVEVFSEKI